MENHTAISESQKGGVVILHAKGKLDSTLSADLEKKIFEFIKAGTSKMVLDLQEVIYINSAGLRMLLSVKKKMKELPGKFIVCGMRTEVMEVMKICGFDHVLDISTTEEEALRKF